MKRSNAVNRPIQPKSTPNSLSIEETTSLFEKELRKRYWAEKELIDILPLLSKGATSYELGKAIEGHLVVTEKQINRLLHIFDILEERGTAQRYSGMHKLLGNARTAIALKAGFEKDSAIVQSCSAIMLHEIKSYKKLLVMAKYIKEDISAAYLAIAISEEQLAQNVLSDLTLSSIYFDNAG